MCWTNSDCLHCVCEKRERRERTHALRVRAHDHFVSQKMTDCSSPKEESLPIQNAIARGAPAKPAELESKRGEPIRLTTSVLIQSSRRNLSLKILMNDGGEV